MTETKDIMTVIKEVKTETYDIMAEIKEVKMQKQKK